MWIVPEQDLESKYALSPLGYECFDCWEDAEEALEGKTLSNLPEYIAIDGDLYRRK